MIRFYVSSLFLILIFCFPTFGQTDSLRFSFGKIEGPHPGTYILTGKVTSKDGAKPIEGVGVHVDGVFTGVSTDRFGTYYLTITPGDHRVAFRHISNVPVFTRILLYENAVVSVQMVEKAFELDGVVVLSDEPDRNVRNPITGVTKLTTTELRAIPAFLGEADIFKGLQLLPGVSSVGEGTSGINVRGAKADQNLLLMNEVLVLSSNHALGFLSGFNTDVTENFTLYKGNLPANFGGRAGSALNILMRPGSSESWQGQVGFGTSNGKVLIEGPVVKDKISVIFGGRVSNVNWLLGQALDLDIQNSRLNFYDGYLGLNWDLGKGHLLEANTLVTGDDFQFSDQFGYEWANRISSLRYKGILGENISITGLLADGNFDNAFFDPEGVDAAKVKNGMRYQQGKVSATWANDKLALTGGLEGIYYQGKPERISPFDEFSAIQEEQVGKERGMELSGFLSLEYELGENTGFVGGLRYSGYSQLGADTVYQYNPNGPISESNITGETPFPSGKIKSYSGFEPRFSLRQNLNATLSVKASYARLFQYIQSVSNTFGPTPIDLWQLSTSYIPPQRSDNFSLGIFKNAKDNSWEYSIDAFYRTSVNQVEYRDFAQIFLNPHMETELVFGKGEAYGAEFLIKKNLGVATGWLAYTYSRSFFTSQSGFSEEQINKNERFPSNYDKPHEVNFILSRRMYPRGLFNFSVNYATGRPVSAVSASYILNGGLVVPDYSNRNQYRIPDYFRVDVSYTIEKVFSKKGDSLNFSIYNLFGRKNAYSVFWQKDEDSKQLRPYRLAILGSIFPSITYSIKWGGKQ
ncbi:carboxypeptidase-like regulatory domain-containing protein [Algoriphagus sp.]|uniref:TonB-dependent receptor n=1 Tax=Algoriphagus sp. TaxID=1872435 RepID=UPI002718725E|nr:carboxypeptidase-like regulatory domain-containing protein [Algoriphagus sp.]MDO8966178.1 carboxypeptidase-like regulatory domain-containing protein [Algoriphagus sp.]MDP3200910.1 carboxypeptidase-like regulatory domain-containing protein [Algoriphagus sp.]